MSARGTLRARRVALRVLGAFATVAIPAIAGPEDGTPGAPRDQYASFNRDSTSINDRKTGLTWERAVTTRVTYTGPETTCPNPSVLGPTRRVPNIKELLTLVDEFPHDQYDNGRELKRAIDKAAFDGGGFLTPTDLPYWSETEAVPDQGAGKPEKKWVVDFTTGEVSARDVTSLAHVRCVRK